MISAQYLAGFFDGEGHIGFCGTKRHTFQLKLSNCNLEVLRQIQETFGGRMVVRVPKKPQHATSYVLTWSARQAVPVIVAMLPFLVVKKREAEFFLEKWQPLAAFGLSKTRAVGAEYYIAREAAIKEFKQIAHERRGTYPLASA